VPEPYVGCSDLKEEEEEEEEQILLSVDFLQSLLEIRRYMNSA
jgi:hypothetical protein